MLSNVCVCFLYTNCIYSIQNIGNFTLNAYYLPAIDDDRRKTTALFFSSKKMQRCHRFLLFFVFVLNFCYFVFSTDFPLFPTLNRYLTFVISYSIPNFKRFPPISFSQSILNLLFHYSISSYLSMFLPIIIL